MYIQRVLKNEIKEKLFKGKIIILYGPRQVGKTTLCKEILSEYENTRYLSCDEPGIREKLTNKSSEELRKFIGNHKLVVIDEAQLVENIGLTLKLIVDNYPELHIFELLITVSGVGPKSGLAILSVAGAKSIIEAVSTNDTSSLTKISGIGRKTAEKIVLELSGKFGNTRKGEAGSSEDIDVFEALKSLGYRERDIQETIKNLPKNLTGANEKIKYALKNLGK